MNSGGASEVDEGFVISGYTMILLSGSRMSSREPRSARHPASPPLSLHSGGGGGGVCSPCEPLRGARRARRVDLQSSAVPSVMRRDLITKDRSAGRPDLGVLTINSSNFDGLFYS